MKTKQSHCEIVENLLKVALMYETRNEFRLGSPGAYKSACRKGWLDIVCSHMVLKKGYPGYWDIFENVREEALNYKTRREFSKGSSGAYESACRNGWLDMVCSHMGKNINTKPRYIYSFVWKVPNLVYVGLTQDPKERKRMHLNNDSGIVYQTIMEYGEPIFKVITENPVHVNVAGEHEKKWIQTYTEWGYTPVNIAKPGSLGGYSRMWDFENVQEEALMYETRLEFFKGSPGAYDSARKNGWLDIVCSHMVLEKGDPGYWNIFENVREEALMYETRLEFFKGSGGAYESARKKGLLDIVCSHMVLQKGDPGYWDILENVRVEALKYKTRSEFKKRTPGAYKSAYRNGWLDMVCSHMVLEKGDPGYWNIFENVREEALKYKTRNEFKKGSPGAYNSACKNGWLDIVCSHMVLEKGDRGYWDIFENVREEALKYKTRNEFKKGSSGAYKSAIRNGWLDIVCSHMVK